MADDPKKAALIAEGMTEAEADYMISGGTKSDGLTPPEEAAPAPEPEKAAEAVAPEVAPEAKAEAAPDEDADLPANTPVPYQRFYREKQRRQAAIEEIRQRDTTLAQQSQEIKELRDKWARLDERLSVFREATAAETAAAETGQPAVPPDPEADPIGAVKYVMEQMTGLAGRAEQAENAVRESSAATQLERSYVTDAQMFARRQPDFGAAYTWLMANRDAELNAAGIDNPQERARIIYQDERDVVARSLQAGVSPAERIYGLAKARGYQMAPAPAPNAGNGAATASAVAAAPAPAATVTDQVRSIERGQAASKSLSGGGGAPAPQGIDLARIADMSDGEYLAWKRSLSTAQVKELQGMLGSAA